MSLKQFLECHDSRELSEIEARNRIDPLDHIGRIEFQLATISALIFNSNRDQDKSEAKTQDDFIPDYAKPYRELAEQAETTEEAVSRVQAALGRFRG
jgi:hypothetical protein